MQQTPFGKKHTPIRALIPMHQSHQICCMVGFTGGVVSTRHKIWPTTGFVYVQIRHLSLLHWVRFSFHVY